MSAGRIMEAAYKELAGVTGALVLAMAARQPVKRAAMLEWASKMRRAADILEAASPPKKKR